MPQTLNMNFLDEPRPDVSVNLDFLGEASHDKDAEIKKIQAERFPASETERAAHPENVAPAVRPWSDAIKAELPLVAPGLLWRNGVRDAFGRMAGTVARDVGGMALTPIRALAHPVDTAEELGRQRERSETRVGQAAARGDWTWALSRGLLNMVPFGPALGEMLDDSGLDPAAGVGHAAALAIGPRAAADAIDAAARVPDQMRDLARHGVKAAIQDRMNSDATPAQQLSRALRPKNTTLDFDRQAETAMPLVKRAAADIGRPVTDLESFDVAREKALSDQVDQQKQLAGANQVSGSGQPIADAIKAKVTKLFRTENPEAATLIDEWADRTYGRDFTFDELDQLRQDGNASLQGYHGKLPVGQMALDRSMDTAIKIAKTRATRQLQIDLANAHSGTGDAFAQTNGNIGSLLTMEDIVDRRWNVEQRQALKNLPQQLGMLARLGLYGRAARSIVAGNPVGGMIDALTGMGTARLADFLRETNSTNGQIASAFRRLTTEPAPVAMGPVARAAQDRALGPASSTVIPSETGSATPGQPLRAQGWSRLSAVQLPQGLRDDPDVFQQTGSGDTTARMAEWLAEAARGARPAESGRLALVRRPGWRPPAVNEEPPIDVEHSPVQTGQLPGAPGQLMLPESTGAKPVNLNPLAARLAAARNVVGSSENPTELPATETSTAESQRVSREDATPGYTITRGLRGRFQKVWDSVRSSERGAVPVGSDEPVNLSEAGRKLLGVGTLVAPEDVRPRRGMFHSFVLDDRGGIVDLGHLTHDVAMDKTGQLPDGDTFNAGDESSLTRALRDNRFGRLQVSSGDMSLEMHHAPSPEALASLRRLVAANPRSKFSWDLVNGDGGELKNNSTGAKMLEAVDSVWQTGKTNLRMMRDRLDEQLRRSISGTKMQFTGGDGPAWPDSDEPLPWKSYEIRPGRGGRLEKK